VRHPVHVGCLLLDIGFALQRFGVRNIVAMAAASRCTKRASCARSCCPTKGTIARTGASCGLRDAGRIVKVYG
jgi:hypothetical protein